MGMNKAIQEYKYIISKARRAEGKGTLLRNCNTEEGCGEKGNFEEIFIEWEKKKGTSESTQVRGSILKQMIFSQF